MLKQPDKVGLYLFVIHTARQSESVLFRHIAQLDIVSKTRVASTFQNASITFKAFCTKKYNYNSFYWQSLFCVLFYVLELKKVCTVVLCTFYLFQDYIQTKLHSWKISFALFRHSKSTLHEHWLSLMFTLKNVSLSWCPGCWNMSKKTATSKQCDHFSPLHWLSAMFQVNKQGLKWPWNNGLYLFTTVAHLPI